VATTRRRHVASSVGQWTQRQQDHEDRGVGVAAPGDITGGASWLPAPEATGSIARQSAACCSAGTQPDPATRHALAGLVSEENRVRLLAAWMREG